MVEAGNQIEMVPCAQGVVVILTTPAGDVSSQLLSWEEFERLRRTVETE